MLYQLSYVRVAPQDSREAAIILREKAKED